jgi:hypothetical protein
MGIKAPKTDFLITPIFDLSSLSSNDPSRTISINPIEPNTGNMGAKSGRWTFINPVSCCKTHPSNSNSMTEGILVLDDDKSNKYATSNNMQKEIIIVDAIGREFRLCYKPVSLLKSQILFNQGCFCSSVFTLQK